MRRVRLDSLLSQRGLFASRSRAAATVLAGEVLLGPERRRAEKPGQMVPEDVRARAAGGAGRSSRAAGSSSRTRSTRSASMSRAAGRWTSAPRPAASPTACCSRGAAHVVALDVAYGELDWRLRSDRARDRDRAPKCPRAASRRASVRPRSDRDRRVVHLGREGARRRCLRARPSGSTAWRSSSRSSRSGARAVGKGGVVRDAGLRRGALIDVGEAAPAARRSRVLGYASSGLPGPKGNLETFVWLAEAGAGRRRRPRGRRRARSSREHGHDRRRAHAPPPARRDRRGAGRADRAAPASAGVVLRVSTRGDEQARARARAVAGRSTRALDPTVDICFALGGDGTILSALRTYAGTGVPVFGVNFGEIGLPGDRRPRGRAHGLHPGARAATSRSCRCPAIEVFGRR